VHLLPALTAQSFKCTAGAITEVEVIITDGAEATITVGDIITIGEIKLKEAANRGGLFHPGRNAFIAVIRFIISSTSSWRVRLNVPQMRSGAIAMRNGGPTICGSADTAGRRSISATIVVSSMGIFHELYLPFFKLKDKLPQRGGGR